MAISQEQINLLEGAYKVRLTSTAAAAVAGCSPPTAHKHYLIFKCKGIEQIEPSFLVNWANSITGIKRAA